jgi:acyl dehydratase
MIEMDIAVSKLVTLDKMKKFMGESKDSIHADPALAESWGLGGAVAQGGHMVAFLNEAMLRRFGDGFLHGGDIAVSFVKAVRSGDTVTARIAPLEETSEGTGKRVHCDVWLENQVGDKVVVGTASALVA